MYTNNEICDVVRQVAIKGNVHGVDPKLRQFCEDNDYIVLLSTGTRKMGTRPAGRALLAERVAQDNRAVLMLFK